MAIPVSHANEIAHRRLIAQQVNRNIAIVKTVTLETSSTTTSVIDEQMGVDKMVILTPLDANAASENIFVTNANGSFTLTHSSAGTARQFNYLIR